MARTRAVPRHISWLFAVAVTALLSGTSVHGAASVAAPAGAMANAHASIGAAHIRQGAPTGRADPAGAAREAAPLLDAAEESAPPGDHPTPGGLVPPAYALGAAAWPADAIRRAGPHLTRLADGTTARAPPAG